MGSCSSVTEPRFLLDTNSLIYLAEQTHELVTRRVGDCAPGEIIVSTIVVAEFALGVDWSLPDARVTFDRLFQAIPVCDFDHPAALAYSTLPFRRNSFDRLIAAHALALEVTLVTTNISDFADMPQLSVVDWTK